MKKTFSVMLILLLVLSVTAFSASADSTEFDTTLTADKTSATVGEQVTVTFNVNNITNEYGFIGFDLHIDYDPTVLKVIGESESFATVNFPASWTGSPDAFMNVVLDEDDNPTGEISMMFTADMESDDIENDFLKAGFKTDDFTVTIVFECIKAYETTTVKVDTDEHLSASYIITNDDGTVKSVKNAFGNGSSLELSGTGASGDTSSEVSGEPVSASESNDVSESGSKGNNTTTIIIIVAIVLVVAAAAVVAVVIIRNKKK